MQNFNDILKTLNSADHVKEIELYTGSKLLGSIESKPGKLGSIKVYNHLFETFGEINPNAAKNGLTLFSEHTEDAQNNPGKHPNIDILLNVINSETTLRIKIIEY